jgi:hypothetical protein
MQRVGRDQSCHPPLLHSTNTISTFLVFFFFCLHTHTHTHTHTNTHTMYLELKPVSHILSRLSLSYTPKCSFSFFKENSVTSIIYTISIRQCGPQHYNANFSNFPLLINLKASSLLCGLTWKFHLNISVLHFSDLMCRQTLNEAQHFILRFLHANM